VRGLQKFGKKMMPLQHCFSFFELELGPLV
jgi:hypothetical protein